MDIASVIKKLSEAKGCTVKHPQDKNPRIAVLMILKAGSITRGRIDTTTTSRNVAAILQVIDRPRQVTLVSSVVL